MAESPLACARIPSEWMNELDEIAKLTGKSRTELIREAIAIYLDVNFSETVRSQLQDVQQRLKIVETKLMHCHVNTDNTDLLEGD